MSGTNVEGKLEGVLTAASEQSVTVFLIWQLIDEDQTMIFSLPPNEPELQLHAQASHDLYINADYINEDHSIFYIDHMIKTKSKKMMQFCSYDSSDTRLKDMPGGLFTVNQQVKIVVCGVYY